MNGRGRKNKGADWERQVAKKLAEWWGEGTELRRTPMSGGWSRSQMRGDLVQISGPLFPFSVECKAQEGWCLDAFVRNPEKALLTGFMQQCWKDAETENKIPLLVGKRNNCPPIAILPADLTLPVVQPAILFFRDNNDILREAAVLMLSTLVKLPTGIFAPKEPPAAANEKP